MRYRENTAEPLAASADETMVAGTASYALLVGLLLSAVGLRSRKYWLVSMGFLLIVSSSTFLAGRLMAAW